MKIECADWLSSALNMDTRKLVIAQAIKMLWAYRGNFDFIAIRGVSGALIGIPVADAFDKPICVVRKPESCHSGFCTEGYTSGKYVIIDDLISSGETIDRIKEALPQSELIGIYLYIQDILEVADHYSQRFECMVIASGHKPSRPSKYKLAAKVRKPLK
jgi:adenine/guanine phosphoribosyltransferase-like PRPP-binding protein